MINQQVTPELVNKLITAVNYGLIKGLGTQKLGNMCVEACVCYAYGLPHSDNPPCVGEYVRNFKINLNDADWSSNQARSKGMIKLSIAQLNSNIINQEDFYIKLRLKVINKILSKLAKKYAPELEEKFKIVNNIEDGLELCKKLDNKISSGLLVFFAAYCSCSDDFYGVVGYYSRKISELLEQELDATLIEFSNACLEILIEMKSPGCEYLYLLDE